MWGEADLLFVVGLLDKQHSIDHVHVLAFRPTATA